MLRKVIKFPVGLQESRLFASGLSQQTLRHGTDSSRIRTHRAHHCPLSTEHCMYISRCRKTPGIRSSYRGDYFLL